jgi:hypothetical protein
MTPVLHARKRKAGFGKYPRRNGELYGKNAAAWQEIGARKRVTKRRDTNGPNAWGRYALPSRGSLGEESLCGSAAEFEL